MAAFVMMAVQDSDGPTTISSAWTAAATTRSSSSAPSMDEAGATLRWSEFHCRVCCSFAIVEGGRGKTTGSAPPGPTRISRKLRTLSAGGSSNEEVSLSHAAQTCSEVVFGPTGTSAGRAKPETR